MWHLNNVTQKLELGEVSVKVEDLLKAMPPGTGRYDEGVLDTAGATTTVMFNSTA